MPEILLPIIGLIVIMIVVNNLISYTYYHKTMELLQEVYWNTYWLKDELTCLRRDMAAMDGWEDEVEI